MRIEAVCFDMDGTLIRNTDSVRYLCTLNNNLDELERIQHRESDGEISWIEADYLKVKLIKGLNLTDVEDNFGSQVQLIQDIEPVMRHMKEWRIRSALITSGPAQIANILKREYGFDGAYGSQYEVKNNKFTGKITTHLGSDGKLKCLKGFCMENGIDLDLCVAVGDSESDLAIFKKCGRSIAINYSAALKGNASEYIVTDNLFDIIYILDSWCSG